MDRFLLLSPKDRGQAFTQAGTGRGLPPGSVEKDFWVCLMLRELFTLPEWRNHLTFKGGTSLSKAWGLIDRFSEDIDLTLERDVLGFGGDHGPEAATSGKEQQRRLKALRAACRSAIADPIAPALTARLLNLLPKQEWSLTSDSDDPDGQTLLFAYPRVANEAAYITPAVKLEFGARSDPWPIEDRKVTPIVAEELPGLFETPAARVRALRPERTFWEKVMLLHEETFRPAGKTRRPRMARHYFDVWRLIQAGVAEKAARDMALFERVAEHRSVYFNQNWVDYPTLKRGSIQMLPKPQQLDEWRADYQAMRGEMFYETPPAFDDILARIGQFQSDFNST